MTHLQRDPRSAVAMVLVLMGFALLIPALIAGLTAVVASARWGARLEAEGILCLPLLWEGGPAALPSRSPPGTQPERRPCTSRNGVPLVVFSVRIETGPGAGCARVGLVGPGSNRGPWMVVHGSAKLADFCTLAVRAWEDRTTRADAALGAEAAEWAGDPQLVVRIARRLQVGGVPLRRCRRVALSVRDSATAGRPVALDPPGGEGRSRKNEGRKGDDGDYQCEEGES